MEHSTRYISSGVYFRHQSFFKKMASVTRYKLHFCMRNVQCVRRRCSHLGCPSERSCGYWRLWEWVWIGNAACAPSRLYPLRSPSLWPAETNSQNVTNKNTEFQRSAYTRLFGKDVPFWPFGISGVNNTQKYTHKIKHGPTAYSPKNTECLNRSTRIKGSWVLKRVLLGTVSYRGKKECMVLYITSRREREKELSRF